MLARLLPHLKFHFVTISSRTVTELRRTLLIFFMLKILLIRCKITGERRGEIKGSRGTVVVEIVDEGKMIGRT